MGILRLMELSPTPKPVTKREIEELFRAVIQLPREKRRELDKLILPVAETLINVRSEESPPLSMRLAEGFPDEVDRNKAYKMFVWGVLFGSLLVSRDRYIPRLKMDEELLLPPDLRSRL